MCLVIFPHSCDWEMLSQIRRHCWHHCTVTADFIMQSLLQWLHYEATSPLLTYMTQFTTRHGVILHPLPHSFSFFGNWQCHVSWNLTSRHIMPMSFICSFICSDLARKCIKRVPSCCNKESSFYPTSLPSLFGNCQIWLSTFRYLGERVRYLKISFQVSRREGSLLERGRIF